MSVPAAFLAVVLIWSTTPLAVKWSGEGPGYLLGALGRMTLAALLCVALLLALRRDFPWHRAAQRAYLSGALGAYGSMLCVYWAAQYLPSGLIAVLFALTPLVTAVLARHVLDEQGLTAAHLAGIALGLAGLVVIFGEGLTVGPHAAAGLGVLSIAVLLHALSLVLVKRYSGELPSLTITSGALLIVVPLFFTTWFVIDGHAPAALPARAVAATVYLGVIGSVVGFTLYFYVIKRVRANTVALITLVTPVAALLVGRAFNAEQVGARVWVGTTLVLSGLALHQWGGLFVRRIAAFAGER